MPHDICAHLEDLPGWANRCVGDMVAHADRPSFQIVAGIVDTGCSASPLD